MRLKTIGALAAMALVLSACGSSDAEVTSNVDTPEGEVSTVTIASLRGTENILPYLAAKHGFFEDQGLDVVVTIDLAGPSIIPSISSDKIQGMVGPWVQMGSLVAGGVHVVGISGLTSGEEDDPAGLYVTDSSSYDSVEDLKGETIAINSPGGITELGARGALENAGLNPGDADIITIPVSEMPAALRAGTVAAAMLTEPFVSLTERDTPLRKLAGQYSSLKDGEPIPGLSLMVTRDFAVANPETVERLRAGIEETIKWANENPDEVRAELEEFAGIDASVAMDEGMLLPTWASGPVDPADVQYLVDLQAEYGLIPEAVDVTTNVVSTGPVEATK